MAIIPSIEWKSENKSDSMLSGGGQRLLFSPMNVQRPINCAHETNRTEKNTSNNKLFIKCLRNTVQFYSLCACRMSVCVSAKWLTFECLYAFKVFNNVWFCGKIFVHCAFPSISYHFSSPNTKIRSSKRLGFGSLIYFILTICYAVYRTIWNYIEYVTLFV